MHGVYQSYTYDCATPQLSAPTCGGPVPLYCNVNFCAVLIKKNIKENIKQFSRSDEIVKKSIF
jgi:hypothetical protein